MRRGMKKPVRGIDDNRILTPSQASFLREFKKSDLRDIFRLTGGTALIAFYLEHRLSEDLDFFSGEKFPFYICKDFISSLPNLSDISYTKHFDRNIFTLSFTNAGILKVEFVYYPLINLETPETIGELRIDSFLDIIVNKLCAIADRYDIKDYVDLYWALKNSEHTLENLIRLAEKKCEIPGIQHVLKNRLLQPPKGIGGLSLKVSISETEMKIMFKGMVKEIIEKEIN